MFDFGDIHAANAEQQTRAWAVEQAIDHLRSIDVPYQDVIVLSKMIEDYVVHADTTGVIQSAVEEGYSEGRFEAKEAAESEFHNLDLDEVFKSKGWFPKNDGPK